jgi:uncharacterized protein
VELVGKLSRLRRYPVKGMAGEDLDAAHVTYAGLLGDRVFAFIDAEGPAKFPWMTARKGQDMILFRPRFLNALPIESGILSANYAAEVITPEGETLRADDPALKQLLEKRYQRTLEFRYSERSMTDLAPISVFGLATAQALSKETGVQLLDPLRFRATGGPFFEDSLVGRELRIGESVAIQIVKKDGRCVMINLDPDTAVASPVVLEKVARQHEGCLGVYAAVLREGVVRASDPIYLA